jgi:hypothetical protein
MYLNEIILGPALVFFFQEPVEFIMNHVVLFTSGLN